jgi:hypothetical protein
VILRSVEQDLREWLEFHRLVGIERFFVYDNASTDESWDLLLEYQDLGFVTAFPWDFPYIDGVKVGAQKPAYAHALSVHGQSWRWMAFLDADEFLFPVNRDDLRITLEDYATLPGLGIFWLMFGTSGHQHRPEGLVIRNYTRRAPFPIGTNMKSIVDPKFATRVSSIHRIVTPLYDERCAPIVGFNKAGFRQDPVDSGSYVPRNDVFRLHHYYTKSASELDAKIGDRNSA